MLVLRVQDNTIVEILAPNGDTIRLKLICKGRSRPDLGIDAPRDYDIYRIYSEPAEVSHDRK